MRKLVSTSLAATLVILSAGLAPYEAAAQVLEGPAPASIIEPPLSSAGPLAIPPAADSQLFPVPVLAPAAMTLAQQQPLARLSNPSIAVLKIPIARHAPFARAPAALAATVLALQAPQSTAGKRAFLFHAFDEGPRAVNVPALNGGLNASEPQFVDPPSALPPEVSIAALSQIAQDVNRPDSERFSAIRRLWTIGSPEAQEALKAAAGAHPEGGDDEYEIKRAALAALAELGTVESLPAASAAHAKGILDELAQNAPAAVITDYDGTLEDYSKPATPETAAAFGALKRRGVKIMVLTERIDYRRDEKDVSILDSLSTLSPAEKSLFVLGARRGARIIIFDRKGQPILLREEPPWTPKQMLALRRAGEKINRKYGTYLYKGKIEGGDAYDYTRYLPPGTPEAIVQEAAREFQADLQANGMPLKVTGRLPYKPEDPPYLTLSKVDKSLGVTLMRRHHRAISFLMRLARWGMPPGLVSRLGRVLLGDATPAPAGMESLPASWRLLLGDHFFGARNTDANMLKGAPGALAISFGGLADPRLANIFVWPVKGPLGTREVLRAAAGELPPSIQSQGREGPPPQAPAPEPKPSGTMNTKAIVGLFITRSLSITAFLLTSITYPFIVLHTSGLGPAALGTLLALGPLAAVALGPLNGLIVTRLSARNSMAVNALIRGLLAFDIPLMMHFGILNFWVLFVSSIANSWILSSIMVTEQTYIKTLAGADNVRTINALAGMNYFALQVFFGLLIGVGSLVDKWPVTLPYNISTAVHLFLVLPILWFTIPNIKISAEQSAAAAAKAATPSLGQRLVGAGHLLKIRWKELGLMGAAIALGSILHSTFPITAALLFWISRTESFKALWKEKNLRVAMLLSALGAFLVYPLQNFALPNIALALAGASGKSLLYGQLLGALFFGQLIANSSQADSLPKLRIPFTHKRIGLQRLIQAAVLGLAKLWLFLKIFHGSIPLTVAGLTAAIALMALAGRLTDRGWIKFFGFGLAAIWLPLLAWGNVPILFVSVLVAGLFYGPAVASINAYFQNNARAKDLGKNIGIQSSFFNAALSFGYEFLRLIAGLSHPSFPATLVPMGILFALGGVLYWLAPKALPGLTEKVFKFKPGAKNQA